ncbi:hypothetical protein WJ97_12385 [Burkholderia ubonensis]|nr:hypothetical protein WJ97_12385 [Burkholderia ubonensis]
MIVLEAFLLFRVGVKADLGAPRGGRMRMGHVSELCVHRVSGRLARGIQRVIGCAADLGEFARIVSVTHALERFLKLRDLVPNGLFFLPDCFERGVKPSICGPCCQDDCIRRDLRVLLFRSTRKRSRCCSPGISPFVVACPVGAVTRKPLFLVCCLLFRAQGHDDTPI